MRGGRALRAWTRRGMTCSECGRPAETYVVLVYMTRPGQAEYLDVAWCPACADGAWTRVAHDALRDDFGLPHRWVIRHPRQRSCARCLGQKAVGWLVRVSMPRAAAQALMRRRRESLATWSGEGPTCLCADCVAPVRAVALARQSPQHD